MEERNPSTLHGLEKSVRFDSKTQSKRDAGFHSRAEVHEDRRDFR